MCSILGSIFGNAISQTRSLVFFARCPTKSWQPSRTGVDRRLSPHDSVGTEAENGDLVDHFFSARYCNWEILYCEMLFGFLNSSSALHHCHIPY